MDPFAIKFDMPPPPPRPMEPEPDDPRTSFTQMYLAPPPGFKKSEFPPQCEQPASPDEPDWRGVIRNKVEILPIPEKDDWKGYTHDRYFWFDTPDYADPFKKLAWANYWFGKFGLVCAGFLGYWEKKPVNLSAMAELGRRGFVPWYFSLMAASISVVTVANLRGKKDDVWNYVPGGLIMAWSFHKNNPARLLWGSMAFVGLAVISKYNAETNGNMYPFRFNYRGQSQMLGRNGPVDETKFNPLKGNFRYFNLHLYTRYGDPGRDVIDTTV